MPPAAAKAAPAPEKRAPSRTEKPATGQAANFDLSLLDQLDNLDMKEADELFDPDKLAASAASDQTGNKISFDDALLQGIIGNVDDQ